MRIDGYSMEFASRHAAVDITRRSIATASVPSADPSTATAAQTSPVPSGPERSRNAGIGAVVPDLAATAPMLASDADIAGPSRLGFAPTDIDVPAIDSLRMQLLRLLLEKLTGREIDVIDPRDLDPSNIDPVTMPEAAVRPPANRADWVASTTNANANAIVWSVQETRIETERTEFQARGVVQTADGQRIDLEIDLRMSRRFIEQRSLQGTLQPELQDPLVVNFDAPAAALTDTRFAFDLDADGEKQQVAFLRPGSGFLAIDRNDNGKIDNGSELFGPLSGDGFAELRRYDADGNGWIDANDPVYERLRVWTRDAQGRDQLLALGEVGVGAIYLGHVATPFDLRHSEDNALLGQVRSTGVWVGSDGRSGTVQQIDLTA